MDKSYRKLAQVQPSKRGSKHCNYPWNRDRAVALIASGRQSLGFSCIIQVLSFRFGEFVDSLSKLLSFQTTLSQHRSRSHPNLALYHPSIMFATLKSAAQKPCSRHFLFVSPFSNNTFLHRSQGSLLRSREAHPVPSISRIPCRVSRAARVYVPTGDSLRHVSSPCMQMSGETGARLSPDRPSFSAAKFLNVLTNLFPLWVLLCSLVAVTHPPSFLWFRSSYIVPLLSLIMLGMGLTLSPASFSAVARTPKLVIVGTLAQYSLMPLLARTLAYALRLPPALAAGVILVGVCPGGTASNVVSLLAGADVALSVVLTLMSTLLSVVCIPLFMSLLAGTLVPVRPLSMLLSTAQVVLFPLLLGAFVNRIWPQAVRAVATVLPLVSVISVTLICAGVVAANASALVSVGPMLIFAVAAMHALGGLFGYIVARVAGAPKISARTISIEVMMQNSSLAVSLANAQFANPLTAVPGAISATMHSLFGSILAGYWRIQDARNNNKPV